MQEMKTKSFFDRIGIRRVKRIRLRNIGIFVGLLILIIVLAIMSNAFLTTRNLINVMRQASIIGVASLGMTFLLITGAFDLSVGAIIGITGAFSVGLQDFLGVWPAIIVALLAGVIIGLVNGLIVAKLHVNAFVTTLGTLSIVRGILLIYNQGKTIFSHDETFAVIGSGYVGPVPIPVVIFIVLIIIFAFVLSRTRLGRYVYAVGGNEEASAHSGINVDFYKITSFILVGFTAAVSGVILASRLQSVAPTAGTGYELQIIAAVVIGGTSISGGEGSIWRTVAGVIVLTVISNGLNLLNVSEYVQLVIRGVIIIAAVAFDIYSSRRFY
jgi:ribose transport system permease protein